MSDKVTAIGSNAFYYCTALTQLSLGNSVEFIGTSAFAYCTNLTTLNVPSSVSAIKNNAFYSCKNLVFNCALSAQPEGWESGWCPNTCTVNWNA